VKKRGNVQVVWKGQSGGDSEGKINCSTLGEKKKRSKKKKRGKHLGTSRGKRHPA